MAGNINPNPFTTRPEIDGTFGVVSPPGGPTIVRAELPCAS